MQINVDLQISIKTKICPSMAQMCGRSKKKKKDDSESSITKCVILVIHVHR